MFHLRRVIFISVIGIAGAVALVFLWPQTALALVTNCDGPPWTLTTFNLAVTQDNGTCFTEGFDVSITNGQNFNGQSCELEPGQQSCIGANSSTEVNPQADVFVDSSFEGSVNLTFDNDGSPGMFCGEGGTPVRFHGSAPIDYDGNGGTVRVWVYGSNAEPRTATITKCAPVTPLSCSPLTQEVARDTNATITASGGTGTYPWSGGGTPPTGNQASFMTQWSSTGLKTVTVTSGTDSEQCTVDVTSGGGRPSCAASFNPTPINSGQSTALNYTVSGGAPTSGSYSCNNSAWGSGSFSSGLYSLGMHSIGPIGTGQTTRCDLTFSNSAGSGTCYATVTVIPIPPELNCTLDWEPPSLDAPGGSSDAKYTSGGDANNSLPYSCSGGVTGSGNVSPADYGRVTFNNIPASTTCSITAADGDDSVTCTRTVTVGEGPTYYYCSSGSQSSCVNAGSSCPDGQVCYTNDPDCNNNACGGGQQGGGGYICDQFYRCLEDPNGQYSSPGECDVNCHIILPPRFPKPDLVSENLARTPLNAVAGNVMSFSAYVRNQGSAHMRDGSNSHTRLRIDVGNDGGYDIIVSPNQNTGQLNINERVLQSWPSAWTAEAGTHKFQVCADWDDQIDEDSEENVPEAEQNNCATHTFTVSGAVTHYACTGPDNACQVDPPGPYTSSDCCGACPTPPPGAGISCELPAIPQSGPDPFSPVLRADLTSPTLGQFTTYKFYCLSSSYQNGNGIPDYTSGPISGTFYEWQSDCAYLAPGARALTEVTNSGERATYTANVTATCGCPGGLLFGCANDCASRCRPK